MSSRTIHSSPRFLSFIFVVRLLQCIHIHTIHMYVHLSMHVWMYKRMQRGEGDDESRLQTLKIILHSSAVTRAFLMYGNWAEAAPSTRSENTRSEQTLKQHESSPPREHKRRTIIHQRPPSFKPKGAALHSLRTQLFFFALILLRGLQGLPATETTGVWNLSKSLSYPHH